MFPLFECRIFFSARLKLGGDFAEVAPLKISLIWLTSPYFLAEGEVLMYRTLRQHNPNFVKNWGGWEFFFIFYFSPTALNNRTVLKKH